MANGSPASVLSNFHGEAVGAEADEMGLRPPQPRADGGSERDDELARALANAEVVDAELRWFAAVLNSRLRLHFGDDLPVSDPLTIVPPPLPPSLSPYTRFVRQHDLDPEARLLLMLALAPHVRPSILDGLFIRNPVTERGCTELGGVRGTNHGGFLPTGETALFLLAGDDLGRRFRAQAALAGRHVLFELGVLRLESVSPLEPACSGALLLGLDHVDAWTTGRSTPPAFGPHFPAHRLRTRETWDDLVLDSRPREQVQEIVAWMRHGPSIMREWGFERHMKPGYRALFHGPSGTGKTMTASLLGADVGREVYRVDLSMVVSKYIGETEKNLARVFEQAEGRGWILFFDEADALFGRRTQVKDSHDRFANQQVSYLLQRVEEYDGLVILATNLRDHIDAAFNRRFHSVVQFPMPSLKARRRIWEKLLAPPVRVEEAVSVGHLAKHELSGGAILNAVRHATLLTLVGGRDRIDQRCLVEGVRRELLKEGRSA